MLNLFDHAGFPCQLLLLNGTSIEKSLQPTLLPGKVPLFAHPPHLLVHLHSEV